MYFNYFSSQKFKELRAQLSFNELDDNVYLCAYKLRYSKFRNIIKKIFPAIYIEKDLFLVDQSKLLKLVVKKKIFYICGYSFFDIQTQFNKIEAYTFILNIQKPIETLYLNFEHSVRKNIKKAEKLGLRVQRVKNQKDFKKYYDALKKFRNRLGFKTDSFELAKKMWGTLHSHANNDSSYEIFICCDLTGELLSGLGIIINWETKSFIEVAAVRTSKCPTSNDFLKWNIIKWAKNNGLAEYNMAGVNPNSDKNSKEYNIWRAKKNGAGS